MRIVLLCEAPICVDAGGIAQTLYNIVSFTAPENLLCISPEQEIKSYPPSAPYTNCYIGYKFQIFSLGANRISKYVGKYIELINFSINQYRSFRKIKQAIINFQPNVIISCPNGAIGVLMHQRLLKNMDVNIFPYFMDDWMYQIHFNWLGGNLHTAIKQILQSNTKWLVISSELKELLSKRYQVYPKNYLVIRNPVDITDEQDDAIITPVIKDKKEITIAYAGALWDMHYDSFLLAAKAIHQLQLEINVRLVLYCATHFWEWRGSELQLYAVEYGGNIPYAHVHQKLKEADAVLLVSSFSAKVYTHSSASIQTKITDYLKAKKLIISCGPSYSANHQFLKTYDCGYCIESDIEEEVVAYLKQVITNLPAFNYKIQNGYKVLQEEFSKEVVHRKLKNFMINEISAA